MNVVDVTLREWETLRPDRGSPLVDRNFGNHETDRRLAEQLTDTGRIEILELARGLELRATSFVGRFRLGDINITVHPKITGAPLIHLLRYAYGLHQLDLYHPIGYASAVSSFQDLLIQQLAAEATALLQRGIHRDYVRISDDLASPRGRIDFNRYVGIVPGTKALLPCIHYPRIEDTLLNQVVLGGLLYAARLTNNVNLRAQLNRLAKTLADTVSLRRLDATLLADVRRVIDRRTTHYEAAIVVIGLLLQDEGIALDGDVKRVTLPGFLFDMNRFFQALISRFLRDHLTGVVLHDEYRLNELFSYAPGQNPRGHLTPKPRPDFVLIRGGRMVAVLDAKYRDLWEKCLPREMLYQLSMYALGRNDIERTAVILYPTIDAAAREQTIVIHEPVRGNSQAQVVLRPVNLLKLEELLRAGNSAYMARTALAHWFSFGGNNVSEAGAANLKEGTLKYQSIIGA